MKVIVCGGRAYSNRQRVFDVLDVLHAKTPITLIIHGGATGADNLAYEWAMKRHVACAAFQADWANYGRAAGPIRNALMLEERPAMVVAFPGGRGTLDMVQRAMDAHVLVLLENEVSEVAGGETCAD